jgi:UDP-sugar transporter A1/2/3
MDLKYLSLLVLVIQNTTLVLSMRVSRTMQNVPMYLSSVAVMTDELLKLAFCCVMLYLAYRKSVSAGAAYQALEHGLPQDGLTPPSSFASFMKTEVFKSAFEFGKMAVPAILYAIQKNLLYTAISNLDAAIFQVAYQGKILTTALFAVLVLRKQLSLRQILGLVILLVGVGMVQLSSLDSSKSHDRTGQNSFTGLVAISAACFTSGFAAIYFEWVLKFATQSATKEQESYALWVRNFQLATFAAISAGFGVLLKDLHAIQSGGLYQGFTALVWFVVTVEAFGGIVVALVIKYADNILKNFATAISIVTSVIVSAIFLDFLIQPFFIVGTVCVMIAVTLYTIPPSRSTNAEIELTRK